MTEINLPAPLVPADCDLTDFPFMPLEVARLRRSKAWLVCKRNPALAFYMLNLWTASWHDKPAGSLEDDDDVLADLAMCDPAKWPKVKADVLRGWVKCSDGRLYHQTVAEKAAEAWKAKQAQRQRTEAARVAKEQKRRQQQSQPLSQNLQSDSVTEIATETVTASKGEGQGQREIEILPHTPKGGKPGTVGLKSWLEAIRAKGEKPIPPGDAVFAYADEVGLPSEFLHLAWREFLHRYSQPDAKRYRDWRAVFRKAIRGNWLKLWYLDGQGAYALTTVGVQAQRSHGEKAA